MSLNVLWHSMPLDRGCQQAANASRRRATGRLGRNIMAGTGKRLAEAVTRRPWLVIAGWLAVAAALILTAPPLSDITNADQSAFLPDRAESARAGDLAARAFPDQAGSTAVIVVRRADSTGLTDSDVAALG